MKAAASPVRHEFIDALRGIAALMVVYLHMAGELTQYGLAGGWELEVLTFFRRVVDLGKVGVVVFFAISGFVIPFTLMKGGVAPIRNFVVNRIFRLYPAYWLSIVLGVICVWWMQGQEIPASTVAMNFTMLQQFVGVKNVLGLYWTLQIELVFYALCVGLFALGLLQKRKAVFAMALAMLSGALALAAARYMYQMKLPVALLLALAVMFWGCVWRDYVLNDDREAKRLGWVFVAVFVAMMPVISLLAYNVDMGYEETWYRYTFSYYLAMAILLANTTVIRMKGRVMAWLGRVSYSVYLLGFIITALVMVGVAPLVGPLLPAHGYITLVIGLTLAAATVCYYALEAPLIKLGRQLNARWNAEGCDDVQDGADGEKKAWFGHPGGAETRQPRRRAGLHGARGPLA